MRNTDMEGKEINVGDHISIPCKVLSLNISDTECLAMVACIQPIPGTKLHDTVGFEIDTRQVKLDNF